MEERSRVKFNPVTKEIEIEGSEKFVKTYFNKLQSMFSGTQKTVARAPVKTKQVKAVKEKPVKEKAPKEKPVKKARPSKKAPKVAKKAKKVSKSNAVLTLIKDSPEGITTTELKEKTGLANRQIWAIIANAKKAGKIRQVKRGLYVGI
jgi:hypothetical protein